MSIKSSISRFIYTHIRCCAGFFDKGISIISCLFPSESYPRFEWQSKVRTDTADFLGCSGRSHCRDQQRDLMCTQPWLRCTAVFCNSWSSLKAKGCVHKLFCISRFQPRGDGNVNNIGQDGMESPNKKVDREHY